MDRADHNDIEAAADMAPLVFAMQGDRRMVYLLQGNEIRGRIIVRGLIPSPCFTYIPA